ncbi:MAG TPA: MarR family transcriptional regulator [Microbacteriaceae bacterium]|nr:MarR family transcriptional regulator [Microbacteriaceae bacterium]
MPQQSEVPMEVAARLAVAIGKINRRLRPRNGGLSYGLLSALASVVSVGTIRPGELARLEAVAAPTVTRIISELEGRGLITRVQDPADGRSFLIEATEDGAAEVLRARAERAKQAAALLAGRSAKEIGLLAAALDVLEAAAADEPRPPAN